MPRVIQPRSCRAVGRRGRRGERPSGLSLFGSQPAGVVPVYSRADRAGLLTRLDSRVVVVVGDGRLRLWQAEERDSNPSAIERQDHHSKCTGIDSGHCSTTCEKEKRAPGGEEDGRKVLGGRMTMVVAGDAVRSREKPRRTLVTNDLTVATQSLPYLQPLDSVRAPHETGNS
ncbi:hypothetical protein AUP68_16038 [Ilyonectria robusta]